MSEVYYKIMLNTEDKLTVVAMQWFDESDYNEDNFFTDENGRALMFGSEEEAEDWLNANIKPEKIGKEHLKIKYRREDYLL